MSVIAERLEQLISLAGGLSAERRCTMLNSLIELSKQNAASFSPRERETLEAVIDQVSETIGEEVLLQISAAQSEALARAVEARASLRETGPQNEERLVGLLRAGQIDEFHACFALVTGLPLEDAMRVLRDETGRTLAAACRKAGLERSTYSAIVVLSDPKHLRSAEQTRAMLRLYGGKPLSEILFTNQAA